MYVVVGNAVSRAARVLWMLEELGQPYEHRPEPPRSAAVRALNPSGKIPVLLDGETVVTDSTAILTYLADRHGAFTHAPGTPARARQDAMTFRVLDEIEGALWTAARHSFVLPEERRVPEVKESLRWEYALNLDRLMDEMETPYLAGDAPTVPDIVLAHCGAWARAAKFPDGDDRFAAYLRRMRARPAFARAQDRMG